MAGGNERSAGVKVLVVDDDALVAMGLVSILEALGYEVVEANSGQEALAVLQGDDDIDLVITDQSMRGMSGTDLARAALEFRPKLPIMLATGYREVPEGVELGLPRLSKPYDDAEVAELAARLLGRSTSREG